MTYKIEQMQKCRIAYMRRTGAYGVGNYALMEKLKAWADDNGLFTKFAIILGISWDNPEITPSDNCRYDTCIVVKDDYEITDCGIQEAQLPGGRYAVFTIDHNSDAVREAWGAILSQLSSCGKRPDFSRPILERYISAMIDKHMCEICVPI